MTHATLASRWRIPFPSIVFACLAVVISTSSGSAHAELLTAEPAPDSLVLSSPAQLTLTFTEPVGNGASVGLVNDAGESVGTSMGAIQDRTVVVNIGSLAPGTYTVTWSAESTTDGHQLAGSYSFRVGGGLPAGIATVEGENPAAWAVALRWLTFAGVSIVLGSLAFQIVVRGTVTRGGRVSRGTALTLVAGAGVALAATVGEPVGQVLTSGETQDASLTSAVQGMPGGWWWRPASLIALLLLSLAIAYPLRRRITTVSAVIGSALSLGALLGLSLTSHAAGRSTWRVVAVASDYVHQASTALWCGGLIALVAWFGTRRQEDSGNSNGNDSAVLSRFSRFALPTFLVAVITGVINAGFVLPVVDRIRTQGLARQDMRDVATSGYGLVLVIKIAVLIVPLILAYLHRARIQAAIAGTGEVARGLLRRTLPIEAIAVLGLVLGGSTLALSAPPTLDEPFATNITLVAPLTATDGSSPGLGHLTVDPVQLGDNRIAMYLTDWNAARIGISPAPRISLEFASLDHAVTKPAAPIQPDSAEQGRWSGEGLNLSIDGWWRITATVEQDGSAPLTAQFYVLVNDPNTHAPGDAPRPTPDPAAEAIFKRGLEQFATWQQVRWRESLQSGADALVVADFAVTSGPATTPPAQHLRVAFSGGFAPINGAAPDPPRFDTRNSITIGDESWLQTANGEWAEEPPSRFDTPDAWHETYDGATSFRIGAVEQVHGRTAQVISFYSPEREGSTTLRSQAEAWFSWWVDVETGDVLRVAMIARLHYMTWEYQDINTGFTIDRPVP